MTGDLAFFEIGVEDTARGRAFYEALFGWTFERGPSEDGLAIVTDRVAGGMHGGDPGGGPYLFFRVDDMDAALARVRQLGGTVEAMDVEGDADAAAKYGRFMLCRDDQGSRFGLYERPAVP